MGSRSLTIDSLQSLYPLQQDIRSGRRHRFREIRVAVPQLSDEENRVWNQRIEAAYFACGCGEGAAAGVLGLLGYGVWAVVSAAPPGWLDLVWLFAVFFVASGVGKAIGLARARRSLAATVAGLEDLLGDRKAVRDPRPGEQPPTPPERKLCAVGEERGS